jgi:ABC-type Zn uptake system ZnuABC Zn-binding protein ZnuA
MNFNINKHEKPTMTRYKSASLFLLLVLAVTGCATQTSQPANQTGSPRVLVVEDFLADIVQNVAGERLVVETLMPSGVDPHSYQPSPQDVARIVESDLLILNQLGMEKALEDVLLNTGGDFILVEASAGLVDRAEKVQQHEDENPVQEKEGTNPDHHHDSDPHFWLDPLNVITYVENIRDGLIQVDPEGAREYTQNAEAYIADLKELHAWIVEQVNQIPSQRRLLVTNHESLGYFADRYGFTVIGSIIPSATTGASPTAQDLANLTKQIQESSAPAIFLETGTNPQLAEQIVSETGIKIAPGIYSHSTTNGEGPASTYLEMMRYNTTVIVEALR